MKKLTRVLVCLALLGLVIGPVLAADPTIKEVMKKANNPMMGLLTAIEKQVKGETPDWDSVQKSSKEMTELCKFLPKNDPPQGAKDSWEKQCKAYADMLTALDAAAGKKDKAETATVAAKIKMSCGACHGPHKPKK